MTLTTMTPAYAIVCGSGSSGLAWEPVATELGARVLPAPDAPDVAAMAAALVPAVAALPRPRVVIGTSLGALIALELARDTPVDALILVSAGFGIAVNPAVLEQIAAAEPGLLDRMARGVVADPGDPAVVAGVRRDFEDGGPELPEPQTIAYAGVMAVGVTGSRGRRRPAGIDR